jgi:nicotinamide riboside kinase
VKRRIAMSGSAGTGKTTLGRRLAAELGLPFIEEGMRMRLEAGLDLHTLGREELRELVVELWDEQQRLESAAPDGFVADRSSADFAAFWLCYGFDDDPEPTERWLHRMFTSLEAYTHVVLLPWGVLPLAADGVRSTNRWRQFQFQSVVEAMLSRFARSGQVLSVPGITGLEGRLLHVLRQI